MSCSRRIAQKGIEQHCEVTEIRYSQKLANARAMAASGYRRAVGEGSYR